MNKVAEEEISYLSKIEIEKLILRKKKINGKAAKELDFYAGSKMRDEIKKITRDNYPNFSFVALKNSK
jgi:hypothetical protein